MKRIPKKYRKKIIAGLVFTILSVVNLLICNIIVMFVRIDSNVSWSILESAESLRTFSFIVFGIGMILGRYKTIKSLNGNVMIVSPKKQVEKIINISGLHKIIPIYETTDKAINSMREVAYNR